MCGTVIRFCFLLLFLIPCVWTDIRTKELPLFYMIGFIISSSFAALLCEIFPNDSNDFGSSFYDLAIGGAIGVFLLLLCRCTKGAIGTGDGILIFAIGITIGALKTIEGLILSCILSSLVAMVEFLVFKRKKDFAIPFAPFLFGGVLGAMFF